MCMMFNLGLNKSVSTKKSCGNQDGTIKVHILYLWVSELLNNNDAEETRSVS